MITMASGVRMQVHVYEAVDRVNIMSGGVGVLNIEKQSSQREVGQPVLSSDDLVGTRR